MSHSFNLRSEKIALHHLERSAIVYIRQSTLQQVLDHQESTRLQYGLVNRALALGWTKEQVLVIDDDLGKCRVRRFMSSIRRFMSCNLNCCNHCFAWL
jgi:hypothetical protein